MKELLLLLSLPVVFIFGYFVMAKVDRFIDFTAEENKKNHGSRNIPVVWKRHRGSRIRDRVIFIPKNDLCRP